MMILHMKALLILASFFLTPLSHGEQSVLTEEEQGISPLDLFNGKDLTGWKVLGGNGLFKVEEGVIIGYGKNISASTFLCTERRFKNFILSYELKFGDLTGNSGVMFRANQKTSDDGNGLVFGYQCEADNKERNWTAGLYDQKRRGWLYPTKEKTTASAYAQESFTAQGKRLFKWDDWNKIMVRCNENRIQIWLNGEMRVNYIDTDPEHDTREGFIGLQVHGGKSCNVMWKSLQLRQLPDSTDK